MEEIKKEILELMHDDIECILSKKQYELYSMNKYMSPKKISEKLNVPAHTVRVNLCRIRKKIEKHGKLRKKQLELRGFLGESK